MNGIRERVGIARTDIPWVEDRLDPELAELVSGYRKKNRPKLYRLIEQHPEKQVLIFKTRDEARDWISFLSLPDYRLDTE